MDTRIEMFLNKIKDGTASAPTPTTDLEVLLNALAGSGASELPTVTADDNDKVLMVKNGAWSVESLPSNNSNNS